MYYLEKILRDRTISVGVVGCGLMGKSLINQLSHTDGFSNIIIASRNIDKVIDALADIGIDKKDYEITEELEEAKALLDSHRYIIVKNIEIAAILPDVVVDCTGDTELGAGLSLIAIDNKTDIVTLNVEMDATVGPYLKKLADEKDIIYTGTAGDEPGAIAELYEFCKLLNFEVIALGKGKNNDLNFQATSDELRDEAISKNLNPRMLTSFVDGTNTATELNSVCNAFGFLPDVEGCHYIESCPEDLAEKFRLKSEGGILNNYKIVDFVKGIAPGVFAIVKAKDEIQKEQMNFLKMGDSDIFSIYRPYHLTSMETPISIIRAHILRDSTISPMGYKPVADTVAIAKRDIKCGESLEGIGGKDVYGTLISYEISKCENLLPIGLVTGDVVAKRDIKKGSKLRYEDVLLDSNSTIVHLRRLQEMG